MRLTLKLAVFGPCLILSFCACAHKSVSGDPRNVGPKTHALVAVKVAEPVLLRLKAEMGKIEKVSYTHRSSSNSFEENQLRHHKEENLEFTSQAETLKVETPDARSVHPSGANEIRQFTQALSILKKDGNADLHDFAMPDLGERLEVTANSLGQIFKSGDYPPNSIFFVSPISLPEKPVSIGDTWTMQASWLSLEDMVPYQLEMVSILKGFWSCGVAKAGATTGDICAEIEISGDVGFQGALSQTLQFKSTWHGRIYFALEAGTVVWSRVDSEERLIADRLRRDVDSCLEAVLIEPIDLKIADLTGRRCEAVAKPETQTAQP